MKSNLLKLTHTLSRFFLNFREERCHDDCHIFDVCDNDQGLDQVWIGFFREGGGGALTRSSVFMILHCSKCLKSELKIWISYIFPTKHMSVNRTVFECLKYVLYVSRGRLAQSGERPLSNPTIQGSTYEEEVFFHAKFFLQLKVRH